MDYVLRLNDKGELVAVPLWTLADETNTIILKKRKKVKKK